MTVWVDVPLVLSVLLSILSRPVVRFLSPRTAAPALVAAAVLTAAASTWGLLLLSATLIDELPHLFEISSAGQVSTAEPVPGVVAAAAATVLLVGTHRLVRVARSHRAGYRALRQVCDASAADELVVVAAKEPHAVAVPGRLGRPGHILITSAILTALSDAERAVLLAHERAHLRGRHHLQRAIVDAAAALNPLLSPTREAVTFLLERCADEYAAETVGSRPLAARSLARAALASTSQVADTLAFERMAVTERVAALHAPAQPDRLVLAASVVLLGVATGVAAMDATLEFTELVEQYWPYLV